MKNDDSNGKIRIKDIAEKAGVSTGTVDRVLHNRGQVSQKTREKIMEIVRQIKYEPNLLASTLASKKVISFACLIPKPVSDSQYWTFPLKGIDKAMEEIKSYGISIKKYHFDQLDEKSFLEAGNAMLDDNPSGVLIAPIHFRESVAIVRNCRNANIPYVFMDSNIKEMDPLCFIGQDPFRSGYVAGKLLHFGKCSEGTVMVINPAREKDNPHLLLKRESGLRSFFNEKGGMNPDTIISVDIEDSDKAHFNEQMHSMLEQYHDLKGIYVSNSKAFKISRFLEEVKRQDIALIGHDLTEHNVKYLKKGTIDFLISQNPMLQGYNGLMALFKSIIVRQDVDHIQLMPIDIISRENLEDFTFHNNF